MWDLEMLKCWVWLLFNREFNRWLEQRKSENGEEINTWGFEAIESCSDGKYSGIRITESLYKKNERTYKQWGTTGFEGEK